jgi:hypothetical protein
MITPQSLPFEEGHADLARIEPRPRPAFDLAYNLAGILTTARTAIGRFDTDNLAKGGRIRE